MFQPGELAGDEAVGRSMDHRSIEIVVHVEFIGVAGPCELNVYAKVWVRGAEGTRDVDGQSEHVAVARGLARGRIEIGRIFGCRGAGISECTASGERAG